MVTKKEAQYWRDKHVLETKGHGLFPDQAITSKEEKQLAKNTAVVLAGVDPDNYDKIVGKPTEPKPADLFTRPGQAREFISKQPIFYDRSGIWWIWNFDENYWELSDEIDILNRIMEEMSLNVVESRIRSEIVTALQLEGRKNIPANLKKSIIQFKNGLVDLDNPEVLFVSNPAYFITNPLPWDLGESEETPTIDKLFKEWVGEEYVETLYQIMSYCLIPDYPIHRIFCFIGEGLNGKSCFLNLLRKFVGDKNVTATELDTLLTSRFEVTRLYKKLVCQMGETNFSEMNKTSMLKKLTGGDLIGFEFKRKKHFEDKNYAKIIISTNNLPATTDKTIGFYRRWLIIDFPNRFSEKVDILSTIPDEEFENLGRKCIKILKSLLSDREFKREGNLEERMKRYEDHSDPLEKFIREFVNEDSDGFIWKFEFEKRLNEWCKENRFRQIASNTIGRKMKEKGIHQSQQTAEWLTDGINKRLRAWEGLSWKEEKDSSQ